MKIESIKIRNVLGARRVDLQTTAPITLVAGFNGAAKSSIQESVRMAFTGETLRVNLKKEYATMVSEGAKSGTTTVVTDAGVASYALPAGSHTLEGDLSRGLPEALPFVLNAQGFAQLKAEDRRTFLFALTNCSVTEDRLRMLLTEAECAPAYINQTLPLLKSITGFPAAAKFAAEKSTEAKGAWRGVTGETYGSRKADGWEAEKPEVDAEAIETATRGRDELESALRDAQTHLGTIKARREQFLRHQQRIEAAQTTAQQLPRLLAKLETDKANLAIEETTVAELRTQAGTAPRVGLEHDFARAAEYAIDAIGDEERASIKTVVENIRRPFLLYVAKYGLPSNAGDPDAIAKLKVRETALTTMQNAVRNSERDVNAAQSAADLLKEQPEVASVTSEDIYQAEQRIATLQGEYRLEENALEGLTAIAEKAKQADDKTKLAASHHHDVSEWAKVAEQLGPDGIPAQLLAQALRPVNTALRESALTTGWRQATINPDMSITAEGRAYNLLCESEKWRVDAMIAEAIAQLSEVRILMLDRVDVLDQAGRVELLMWLAGRAEAGAINTALLFATLKQPPSGLPESINAVWIENGTLEASVEEAAAA